MRNAPVSALIYEFLFDVYRRIEADRPRAVRLPDQDGVPREVFSHDFKSCWEWSISILDEVGATKVLQPSPIGPIKPAESPYRYPALTLESAALPTFRRSRHLTIIATRCSRSGS